jgi:hypothetical protein
LCDVIDALCPDSDADPNSRVPERKNNNPFLGVRGRSHTTGHDNMAVGFQALKGYTTGNNNIGLGSNAGSNLTTGSNDMT